MLRHPVYTRTRIAQVGERIAAHIYPEWCDPDSLMVSGPVDRISLEEAEQLAYRDAKLGEQFGPLWTTYWFRIEATVPPEWAGHRVDLLWVTHSEATLWIGGRSIQGLNTSHEGPRPDALLIEQAAGGEQLELRIELACNGKFGWLDRPYASVEPVVLDRCRHRPLRPAGLAAYHDFDVLRRLEADAANGLDPNLGGRAPAELNRFCNVWDERRPRHLGRGPKSSSACYRRERARVVHELSAIGHAHIDTAWLWPLAETTASACAPSLPAAPTWTATPSSFALLAGPAVRWIGERNPDLYARIRRRSSAGQWVPVGGTWVEPDCNLPSGESLVRQFLLRAAVLRARVRRAAAASSGTPTCSATTASCRRSCAAPASTGS